MLRPPKSPRGPQNVPENVSHDSASCFHRTCKIGQKTSRSYPKVNPVLSFVAVVSSGVYPVQTTQLKEKENIRK